ncbi:MAG: leucine-rich repeat protein [Ruminococcus callidus]
MIGNGVETIGNRAFYGYSTEVLVNLKKVTFGNSIKTIGAEAFANSGISGAITFPDTLETIGESAFGWCQTLLLSSSARESSLSVRHHLSVAIN